MPLCLFFDFDKGNRHKRDIDSLRFYKAFYQWEVRPRQLVGQGGKAITSLEDIFDDDDIGIFDDEAESIFTLKHVSKETNMPDYIASRKPCDDFEAYEDKFIQCQSDLASGERLYPVSTSWTGSGLLLR